MNIIRINGLTIEFENGVEVVAEGNRVIVRKSVVKLPPLAPPMRPLTAALTTARINDAR